ncbi:MAG: class I SAM-dependent methyltransferase [Candidatus Promineifilaceae bacterium]|nr:class I SAM-dependent methyltransferase [Candidatus Promineifilaceae bacterium]
MNHADHVALLQDGIPGPGGVWADFGSGSGAFTLALAELVGPTAEIYAIDKKRSRLRHLEREMEGRYAGHPVRTITADFTRPINLPALDGALMANSLHFLRHKEPALELIKGYLRPGGCLILVEYNVDRGNMWVPHPLSYPSWENLARRAGFQQTRLLSTRPSRFLRQIYSAVSINFE